MKSKYENIEWGNNDQYLKRWESGQTGCPIVDAAMRHLNKKGYMPNRLRMIVSNYLIKDLMIDWRIGEKYFASKLVDYDPSQNNGGWQWAAGCGTDSQPYFRVFNPKLQSEKFDKDCEYILTWIPELKKVKKEHIHDWEEHYKLYKGRNIDYPEPIVKHAEQKKKFLDMYKSTLYGEDSKVETTDDEESSKEDSQKKVVGKRSQSKSSNESKKNLKRGMKSDIENADLKKTKTTGKRKK